MRRAARVVYIGGSGRSGSTLLARIMGEMPGFVTVGEVREVWRAGLTLNDACGCGAPFATCPFWQRVGDVAFGGWSNVSAEDAERAVASFTYLDALRRLRPGPTARRPLDRELTHLLERLYVGLSTAAEGAVLVDTSKGPTYAVALASVPSIDLRAIHLVRDSRGVAYSWSKEVPRPYTATRRFKMHRLSALASVRWFAHHGVMELLGRRVPSTLMRYETFAERARDELLRAASELQLPTTPGALDFLGDHSVRLRPAHVVAGNRMKMATGALPLELDAAWRTAFPVPQQVQVAAMTWPLLLRYGYRL